MLCVAAEAVYLAASRGGHGACAQQRAQRGQTQRALGMLRRGSDVQTWLMGQIRLQQRPKASLWVRWQTFPRVNART